MTSQQILQSDVLDILFEKRNKLYGAYQLRKTYPRQLVKAVVIAVGSVFLLLFILRPVARKNSLPSADNGGVIVRDFEVPPPEQKKPEPPKQPQAQPPQVKQKVFIDQFKIIQKDIITEVPPIDALHHSAIADKTTDGDNVGALQPAPKAEKAAAEGAGNTTAAEPAKEVVPEKQPQFPGGIQAWLAFLNKHLRAPEDLESGEKRTVLIRFHVAEDGSVNNFSVLQSAGSAFDGEVIRVLKKMPKWTPAMKAGQPVPVTFTQPVTFVGIEE